MQGRYRPRWIWHDREMQGGEVDQTPGEGRPAPSASSSPSSLSTGSFSSTPTPPPPPQPAKSFSNSPPVLPSRSDEQPTAITTTGVQPEDGASTWYRSDQARYKSVHRRANPWYRRLGRGIVALTFISALGAGLYFGARLIQDYLERDKLPSPGAEVPEIRRTSFQVRSSTPAPDVDGTLTIDATSRAFEFVGRNGGPQTGIHVVSPDGSTSCVRGSQGGWALMTEAGTAGIDPQDLLLVVRYISNDKNSDAILTNRLRRGYVDLTEQAIEGTGLNQRTRYELELDTLEFSVDYPLQWQDFQSGAIPGVQKTSALPVIIWLDADQVLVRVRDEQTNWSWERLTYSGESFTPIDPASTLLEDTTGAAVAASDTTAEQP